MKDRIKIVADSGSTKTDWRILQPGTDPVRVLSPGINPVFLDEESISGIAAEALAGYTGSPAELYFYGAGVVSSGARDRIVSAISGIFPKGTEVFAGSDLLGASVALFGRDEGLVAILGTGSNSGLYDGRNVVESVPAGGFILGDEGSGAYFGRRLLSDFLKREMPSALSSRLQAEFGLNYSGIVEAVYRSGMPSRYLAGFMEFIGRNRSEGYVKELLSDGFGAFMLRNVLKYGRKDLPLGVIGSVGVVFREELGTAAGKYGIVLGKAAESAGDGLVEFYREQI